MQIPPSLASPTNFAEAVTAVGALGTAAFGVVDATKSVGGGVSTAGQIFLKCLIDKIAPASTDSAVPSGSALTNAEIYATVRANWINGLSVADQKSTLKTLIKLRLNPASAAALAELTGVDKALLASLATKLARGAGLAENNAPPAGAIPPAAGAAPAATEDDNSLTPAELDAYGRFDVMLSTSIDRAYNQADQRYRNWAKVLACFVAIVLAEISAFIYQHGGLGSWSALRLGGIFHAPYIYAFLVGLLATPLAPIAKDVATAISTAAKAFKAVKG